MNEKIWGKHPVREALKAKKGKVERIFIARGAGGGLDEIKTLARSYDVEVVEEDRQRMDDMAGTDKHQGVMALVGPSEETEPIELVTRAKHLYEQPFILILDHIQDPHNLGALIRTAEGCGCHGVVIPSRRGAQVTDTVAKVSAGASAYLPVAVVANINQVIEQYKKENIWIVGADMDAPHAYWEQDFTIPTALVMGAEGEGLSRLTKEKCDFLVKIPMKGRVASLNVSASGAILMAEVVRQRTKAGSGSQG